MKKTINKFLSKFLHPMPKKDDPYCNKSVPEYMSNITNLVNRQLLDKFHKDIEVYTDDVHYVFSINGTVAYWGKVDQEHTINTILNDMIMYPVIIKESINESIDGANYVPNVLGLIPELVKNSRNGNISVVEKEDGKTHLKFNPTVVDKK